MKYLKLSLLALPFWIMPTAFSQALDVPPDFDEAGDTTFPLKDKFAKPQNLRSHDKQLDIQREEEEDVDSFGEDKFNQNVDPDVYKTDEQINKQQR